MKVAVLGANGQVGAELCLLLAQQPKVNVIPICRSRMGSAYLRSQGLPCRHGQPSDVAQAAKLYGDCEIVVNLALLNQLRDPHRARSENHALIRNVAECLGDRGRHLYFSTMSVYGDVDVGRRLTVRSSYGQGKLESEQIARRYGRRFGCQTYIFRLGHVCGELQNITKELRNAIKAGPIPLPDPERASNTVYVATIADAIVKAGTDTIAPGVYDLMNVPQWSWREVLVHEAGSLGVGVEFSHVLDSRPSGIKEISRNFLALSMLSAARSRFFQRVISRILPTLPITWYRRLKATYSIKSAGREIVELKRKRPTVPAVFLKPVGKRFSAMLTPTIELVNDPKFRLTSGHSRDLWPDDLPLYVPGIEPPSIGRQS